MSFKKGSLVFILALISQCIFAQYNISGFAYDATGNRIVNAKVEINGANLKKTIKTNEEGSYTFSNVANGNYELRLIVDKLIETVNVAVNNDNLEVDLLLFSLNDESVLNVQIPVILTTQFQFKVSS